MFYNIIKYRINTTDFVFRVSETTDIAFCIGRVITASTKTIYS